MKTNRSTAAFPSSSSDAQLQTSKIASILATSRSETIADSPPDRQPFDRLASPRIALPLLCALGTLLFLVNLGGYPLYTKGETREAVTVFDIVHGGGIILPMRAGVEVPSKPLMMHWIAALVSLGAGQVNEWTVRLPSAVCAILGIVVCYYYVRRLFDQKSALFAALVLATSFQYLQAGGARVDMMLSLFLEVALFHFLAIAEGLSKRTAPLYLSIAGAILTKGPVGLALPVLVAGVWVAVTQRLDVLRSLKLRRGAAIVGAIGGGWYLAAIGMGGSAFVHKQLLAENVYRFLGRQGFNEGHAHPFYYIEAALVAGFMPWSPVAALAVLDFCKRPRKMSPRFSYMLVWFLAILIFYNLPQSKRGVYLLALYPALSTIIAVVFSAPSAAQSPVLEGGTDIIDRFAAASFITIGISAFIGCAMLFLWEAPLQWLLGWFGILVEGLPMALRSATTTHWIAALFIPLATISIGGWLVAARPSIERIIGGISAGIIAVTLLVNLFIQPAIAKTLSPKQFAIQATERAGARPIYYFGSVDYGFIFYSGRDAKFASIDHPPELIVGSEEQWPLMPAHFRVHYRMVLRSNPTDLDGSGRLLLLSRTDAPS